MSKGNKGIEPKDGEATQFKKGERGNKWGRPPRLVSQILRDVKDDGMEAVTASQVSDVISVLLNYSVEQVKKIAEDKTLPILIQRTARRFAGASDKDWDGVLRDNLNRAHGTPTNKTDLTTNGKDIIQSPFASLPIEKQEEILLMLQNVSDATDK